MPQGDLCEASRFVSVLSPTLDTRQTRESDRGWQKQMQTPPPRNNMRATNRHRLWCGARKTGADATTRRIAKRWLGSKHRRNLPRRCQSFRSSVCKRDPIKMKLRRGPSFRERTHFGPDVEVTTGARESTTLKRIYVQLCNLPPQTSRDTDVNPSRLTTTDASCRAKQNNRRAFKSALVFGVS